MANTKAVTIDDVNQSLNLLISLGKQVYIHGESATLENGDCFDYLKHCLEVSELYPTVAGKLAERVIDLFSPSPEELIMLPKKIPDSNKVTIAGGHRGSLEYQLNELYFKKMFEASRKHSIRDTFNWTLNDPFQVTNDLPEISKLYRLTDCVIYNEDSFYRSMNGKIEKLILDTNLCGTYMPWVNSLIADVMRDFYINETLNVEDTGNDYIVLLLNRPYYRLPAFNLKTVKRMFTDKNMPAATQLEDVMHLAFKPVMPVSDAKLRLGKDFHIDIYKAAVAKALVADRPYSDVDASLIEYHIANNTEYTNVEEPISYNTAHATVIISNHILETLLEITHIRESNKELV